jgi:hypothetical protein
MYYHCIHAMVVHVHRYISTYICVYIHACVFTSLNYTLHENINISRTCGQNFGCTLNINLFLRARVGCPQLFGGRVHCTRCDCIKLHCVLPRNLAFFYIRHEGLASTKHSHAVSSSLLGRVDKLRPPPCTRPCIPCMHVH